VSLAAAASALGAGAGLLAWWVLRRFAPETGRPALVAMIVSTAAAFVWSTLALPTDWALLAGLVLAWFLICLAAIDLAVFRLPDVLTLPLICIGLATAFIPPGASIIERLIGAAAGYACLRLLALAWRHWRGAEGIGAGDAKLLAAAGAWLGWRLLPTAVLVACAAAFGVAGIRLMIRGRKTLREPIAFGAPLSLSIFLVWLYDPYST
jgi:leader peptidase (prepilin peptidase)/N-methyltransferase